MIAKKIFQLPVMNIIYYVWPFFLYNIFRPLLKFANIIKKTYLIDLNRISIKRKEIQKNIVINKK